MLFLSVPCALAALSVDVGDRNFEDKPFVYSPEDALRAYDGDWEGGQDISVHGGRTLSSMRVGQSYRRNLDGSMDCVQTATVDGRKVAERRSRIYVDGDMLVLETAGADGRFAPAYVGDPKSGSVVWSSYYPFSLYDVQTDSFVGVGEFAAMRSEGFRYEVLPSVGFRGLVRVRGVFSKRRGDVGGPRNFGVKGDFFLK